MLVDNVKMKFDSIDIVFNSSAVEASVDEYDTKVFINLYRASFGVATIYFAENIVT